MRENILFATLSAAVLMAGSASATIVIDDFNNSSGGWVLRASASNTPVTKSETGLSGVFGGTRDVVYTAIGSNVGNLSGMFMEAGECAQTNGSSNWSKATLTYNGGGGAGGLGLDLTSGTSISVDKSFDHVGNGKNSVLSVTLSDGMQSATVTKTWTPPQVNSISGTETFLFTSFVSANPALNLSSIDSVAVYLETDNGGDYAMVTGLTTDAVVPEPVMMGLLSLGGFGLLTRRRSVRSR